MLVNINGWQTATDAGMIKTAAAASGGSSVWLWASDVSVAIAGVPLSVVLAAFAGALLWLSMQPAMPARRAVVTVLLSTIVGALVEPGVQHLLGWPDRVAIALGAACGFGLQAGAGVLTAYIQRWGKGDNGRA